MEGMGRTCVSHMRSATEVDERAAAVDGGGGRCDFVADDAALELVVGEHAQQVLPGHLQPLERLLLLADALTRPLKHPVVIRPQTLVVPADGAGRSHVWVTR